MILFFIFIFSSQIHFLFSMQEEKGSEQKKQKITIFIPGTSQPNILVSRLKNLLEYFPFVKCSFKYDTVAKAFVGSFGTYSLNKKEGREDLYEFFWNGGPLSEFARKEAAEALYLSIRNEFPEGHVDINFLCQSHGGNVFGLFLNTLKQMREREDKELSSVLNNSGKKPMEVARNISVGSAVLWETPKYNGGINKYAGLCYQDGRFIAPRIYDVNLNGFGLNEGNVYFWGLQIVDLFSGGFLPCHRKLLNAGENISRVTLECDPKTLALTYDSFYDLSEAHRFMYKTREKIGEMVYHIIDAHAFLIFLQGLWEKTLLVSGEDENFVTTECLIKSFREGYINRKKAEDKLRLHLINEGKYLFLTRKEFLAQTSNQVYNELRRTRKTFVYALTEEQTEKDVRESLERTLKIQEITQYSAEDVRRAKHDYDYMHCITHNKKYFLSCLLALFLLQKYVNNDLKGLVERNYRKILAAAFAIIFVAG